MRDRRQARPKRHVSASRLILSITVIVVFAAGTGAGDTETGERMAAAAQRFLTFYSGVFALVALTMAVAAGLIATDRIFMSVGNRIVAQAVHRAIAFVSVAFLITHIAMEVVVGKSTAIDSVVPFLSRGRTFYVGIGTIASDLMILLVATGIARRRFAEKSSPFVWRVLHGSAYLAWPLSIVHGLAAGRPAKPYVSWSYGACLIAVGIALVVRSVATVRPRQATAQAWPDNAGTPAAASVAAQAYLLHTQRAAAAAGLAAGQPAGLAAMSAGQTMQWPRGGPSHWSAAPAAGMPALPAPVAHTPAQGMPVVPGAVAHTPAGGMPTAAGMEHYTPAQGMPAVPGAVAHTPAQGTPAAAAGMEHTPARGMSAGTGPRYHTPAGEMPPTPPLEYQSPPVGVWPVADAPAPPGMHSPGMQQYYSPDYSPAGGMAPAAGTQYQNPAAGPPVAPGVHYQTGVHYEDEANYQTGAHLQDGAYYQDQAGGRPGGPDRQPAQEYEAVPYQVQALYPAPDDQAGWPAR